MENKIRRGSKVQDYFGSIGIVVCIELWEGECTAENHGTITVWQSEKTNYGDDNCEHYSYFGYEDMLTVLEY